VYPYLDGYSVILDDITKQKTNALRIAKEKDLLSVTLRSIADGVIAVDREGRIIDMSRAAGELTGWEGSKAIAAPLSEVLRISIDGDRDAVWQIVAGVVTSGRTVFFEGNLLVTGAEEMTRRVEGSVSSILDENGGTLGAVVAFRDLTSRKKMEEDLIKAERLVSVGNLAAGIAHDFNNIMTSVLGNISLVRMSLKPGFGLIEKLTESERAILRAQKLTRQLLVFSRGGEPVKKVARLEELVENSLGLSLSGSNLKCDLIVSDDLRPVEVDPGQIGQVVDNLVANAKEAMPEGGTIEVSVRNAEEADGTGKRPESRRFVELSIKDHGPGIPREFADKIFDPYFSTKGEGRGLGLATVHTIIRRHGGNVWVDSLPGAGTTVTIRLPAADRALETGIGEATELVRGEGRILVMDDEEMVRQVTAEILASLGYEVVTAKDGEEAVRAYKESVESCRTFDAVILDLTVPGGMGGKEAVRRMKEIDPEVKAIICSGYSGDSAMANCEENGFRGVIPKPYSVEELSKVLSSVIRGAE
jgi:PAS domain S-box-containing protein